MCISDDKLQVNLSKDCQNLRDLLRCMKTASILDVFLPLLLYPFQCALSIPFVERIKFHDGKFSMFSGTDVCQVLLFSTTFTTLHLEGQI